VALNVLTSPMSNVSILREKESHCLHFINPLHRWSTGILLSQLVNYFAPGSISINRHVRYLKFLEAWLQLNLDAP
jgi:hypothetical protein